MGHSFGFERHGTLFFLSLVLFMLVFIPTGLQAQKEEQGVKGTVLDSTGDPLPYVNIKVPSLDRGSSTDEKGRFRIPSLASGSYELVFSKLGFERVERSIEVPEGGMARIEVRMREGALRFGAISISGSSVPQGELDEPDRIETLDKRELRERSSASLGGTLEESPGMDNISTGSPFGKPVIRGMSGNRIRLLQDGVPMEYQQYGVRHMPNVDPFLSERIEVLQGPSSVLYGSDAFGGVVNNIPRSIPDTRDSSFRIGGKAMGTYHSNDRQWGTGIATRGGAKGFGFDLAFVRRSGGNIRTADVPTYSETGKAGAPKFSGELDHTDFDQYNGSASIGYKGKGWELSGRTTSWNNEHNFLLPNGKGLGQRIRNRIHEVRGGVRLDEHWVLEPSVVHLVNRRRSNAKGRTRELIEPGRPGNLDIRLESHVDRLTASHGNMGGFSGKVGLEHMYVDQTTQLNDAPEPLVPSGTIRNYGVFLFERFSKKGWTIVGGARFDHRRQRAEPNEALKLPDEQKKEGSDVLDQRYSAISGGLGVNYRFNHRFSASLSAGRGFRAPSLFDLHAHGVHGGIAAFQRGDPTLSPEYALNTDLSLTYASDRVEARVTAYRNAIRDYIYKRNIGRPDGWKGPPITQVDQGNAVLTGGHAFVRFEFLNGFELEASYQVVEGMNRSTGEELPLMPPSRLRGDLRYEFGTAGAFERIHIEAGGRHTFAQEAAGRFEPFWQFENLPKFGFGVASTDPYTLFHIGVGTDLKLWKEPITLDVEVRNLTNEPYRDFLDTYKGYALGMGRNIKVKMTVPF